MNLNHLSEVELMDINEGVPLNMSIPPSMFSGANNGYTNFPFRVEYLLWILRGANLLKPLQYYGAYMNECTDDGETLRGAYGPRMRFWIGADALQEAINANQDIDMEKPENQEAIVKPKGIDQLNAVYEDLKFGMKQSLIQVFDPAIDFEETNYVPDLHRVSFLVNDNKLDIIMDYLTVQVNTTLVNDMWVMEIIQMILASFLSLEPGTVYVNVGRAQLNKFAEMYTKDMVESNEWVFDGEDPEDFCTPVSPEKFWEQNNTLMELDKHIRMQITATSFNNKEVSVSQMANDLVVKFVNKIDNKLLNNLGRSLLMCAVIKNADTVYIYKEFIKEHYKLLDNIFRTEFRNYAFHINVSDELDYE